MHMMAVELFASGSILYNLATDGTGNLNGTARATLWYEILAVWMPLAAIGGISLWSMVREYRRRVQTVVRQTREPP